jgi:hypothetical protein
MSDLRGFIDTPSIYDPQALREKAVYSFTLVTRVFVLVSIWVEDDSSVVSNGMGVYLATTSDYP